MTNCCPPALPPQRQSSTNRHAGPVRPSAHQWTALALLRSTGCGSALKGNPCHARYKHLKVLRKALRARGPIGADGDPAIFEKIIFLQMLAPSMAGVTLRV